MFHAILAVQWKWSRLLLVFGSLVAAAIPLTSARSDFSGGLGFVPLLTRLEAYGFVYPLMALVLGGAVAVAIWLPDRQGRHVYGMSMPLPRWHFVLLRYGAGLLLVLVPALALLAGGVLAALTTQLPPGLHAYPAQLTLRFALACVVAFSFAFPLAAAERSVVAGVIGALILLAVLSPMVAQAAAVPNPLGWLLEALFSPPGPFSVFSGRWMLFDV
jgi:hypothetical protein